MEKTPYEERVPFAWKAACNDPRSRLDILIDQALVDLPEGKDNEEQKLHFWRESIDHYWLDLDEGKEHLTAGSIVDFLSLLASTHKAESLLDPTCGMGLLLAQVARTTGAKIVHGVDINQRSIEISKRLIPTGKFFHGDFFLQEGLAREYDFIVGHPPFGLCLNQPGLPEYINDEKKVEFIEGLAFWIAQHLAPNGTAILFTNPSFYFSVPRRRLWDRLKEYNAGVRACIHIPGHLFEWISTLDVYAVVIDRKPRDQIFVAQYLKDDKHQHSLVKNYAAHQAGGPTAQGRLVSWECFNGFPSIEAGERASRLARKAGLEPTTLASLSLGINQAKRHNFKPLAPKPNCIYIPSARRGKIVASQDELPEKLKTYFQVELDDSKADANFVAPALNTELGQATLDTIRKWRGAEAILAQDLDELKLYLPNREEQLKATEVLKHINKLQLELRVLENSAWDRPGQTQELEERVQKINHEDRYDDWMETLPFPLASILWLHHTEKPGRRRFEVLLQFFEGLAQFTATLLISALQQDEKGWLKLQDKLNISLEKAKLSFDRATFGTWKTTCEVLGSHLRKAKDDDSEEMFVRLFKTRKTGIRKSLLDGEIDTVLKQANKIRNDCSGHGGAMGEMQAESLNERLQELVADYRSVVGESWRNYQLVKPDECRYRDGLYHYSVQGMMGTRTPFMTVERECIEALEDDSLYMLDPDSGQGLKLQPFFQIMPSPSSAANACYFYNRKEGDEHRLVSYHFEEESEVVQPFDEIGVALKSLKSSES